MRKMSMATRKELIEAVGARYRACDRSSKGKVLDEFVAVTGFHRKHAMRVLRQEASDRTPGRVGRRVYDEAVRTALVVLRRATVYAASGLSRSFRSLSKRWKVMVTSIWRRRSRPVCSG